MGKNHQDLFGKLPSNFNNQILFSRRVKTNQILALMVGFLLFYAYGASAGESSRCSFQFKRNKVKVMTQNVYHGADILLVADAETPYEIPVLVSEAFQMILYTDFPERAEALADLIKKKGPDLIGLQEVVLIRRQSPGDFLQGNPEPAEYTVLDYLDILLSALEERNLYYEIAAYVENIDVELPMAGPDEFGEFGLHDVRLTDHDVILAKKGIAVSNVISQNYEVNHILPVGPMSIESTRGFVAIDAMVRGRTYRFVNTHLELWQEDGLDPQVQTMQAQELIEVLSEETVPVIVVGDFNAIPDEFDTDAYALLTDAGYVDVWQRRLPRRYSAGFSCCQNEDLMNEYSMLDERIDHIFVRNDLGQLPFSIVGTVFASVMGDKQEDKTDSGLWPSDHAGVFARLRIPLLDQLWKSRKSVWGRGRE